MFTFYATAALQFAGVLVRATLLFVVPLYERDTPADEENDVSVSPLSAADIINAELRRPVDSTRNPGRTANGNDA